MNKSEEKSTLFKQDGNKSKTNPISLKRAEED